MEVEVNVVRGSNLLYKFRLKVLTESETGCYNVDSNNY